MKLIFTIFFVAIVNRETKGFPNHELKGKNLKEHKTHYLLETCVEIYI